MARILPPLVAKLTHAHEGWVVGSAANPTTDLTKVRDWDILIPFGHWQAAAMMLPSDAVPNTFGGWKCPDEGGVKVDVWPGDLAWLMTNQALTHVWHPRTGARWVRTFL